MLLTGKTCKAFFLLCFLVSASACTQNTDPLTRTQFFAFGTLVEISLYGVPQALADKATAAAEEDFQRMHKNWHGWHPSDITTLNQKLAANDSSPLTNEVQALIHEAKRLSLQSNGLFNPAIGQLIRLWGFQEDDFSATTPPDPEIIQALLNQHPGMDNLMLQDGAASSNNPAIQLDLGAVAKGYGIDQVITHLRELGVQHAIVNCGGDLRAIGSHGSRPWRIGIRKPRGSGVLASVELGDGESVFTSGDYERYFLSDGKRYHHILDPRTGYPAQGVTSVTVIHPNAATADAAATALFVAGEEQWWPIAKKMGIRYVMLVDDQGVIHMNPGMEARVQFEVDPLPTIKISKPL